MKKLLFTFYFLLLASLVFAGSGSDNLARTSNPINGTWANYCWQCASALQLNGTAAVFSVNTELEYSAFTGYTSANNQQATIQFANIDITDCSPYECYGGPAVRIDGLGNFYSANIFARTSYTEVNIWRSDGTADTINSDSTQWATGDIAKLQIVGTTLNLYRDTGGGFGLMFPGSNAELSSGQPGIAAQQYYTASGAIQLNNFSASDISGGAAPKNHPTVVVE